MRSAFRVSFKKRGKLIIFTDSLTFASCSFVKEAKELSFFNNSSAAVYLVKMFGFLGFLE